jgi:hypothetical protein
LPPDFVDRGNSLHRMCPLNLSTRLHADLSRALERSLAELSISNSNLCSHLGLGIVVGVTAAGAAVVRSLFVGTKLSRIMAKLLQSIKLL